MSSSTLTAEGRLAAEVDQAFEQYRADLVYEQTWPTVRESAKVIRQLGRHSAAIARLFIDLSPVAEQALLVSAQELGLKLNRALLHELRVSASRNAPLVDACQPAADFLVALHSPIAEAGQGAGSALGRESDLRAIPADYGRRNLRRSIREDRRFPQLEQLKYVFRQPKDKLGLALIRAYLTHQPAFDVGKRGAATQLRRFLDEEWLKAFVTPPPSWRVVLDARRHIAVDVARSARVRAIRGAHMSGHLRCDTEDADT